MIYLVLFVIMLVFNSASMEERQSWQKYLKYPDFTKPKVKAEILPFIPADVNWDVLQYTSTFDR